MTEEMYDRIEKLEEYLRDFISVLEDEGESTYYSDETGKVVHVKELKNFLEN